ncbi:MAG: serine protease [Rhodospirillales bacterium]
MLSRGVPVETPFNVEFSRRPVVGYSSGGTKYTRWVTDGLPQLGKYSHLLKTPFFLYRNAEDARAGANSGGTGFLLGVALDEDKSYFIAYAITNWHVAVQLGFSTIRINCREGAPDIFEFDPAEWFFNAGSHDIAAVPIKLDGKKHDAAILQAPGYLLSQDFVEEHEVGPGDDVFMIGRFVDYDGVEVNKPAMRFGNISVMEARVRQDTGCDEPSILVDMHSRTGFSGSPVFVYRTTGSMFAEKGEFVMGHTMKLLGIHWGQFPEMWEIKKGVTKTQASDSALVTEGDYVKGFSGMTCVCPAWAIWDLLNKPELAKMRETQGQIIAANAASLPAESDVSEAAKAPPTTECNPDHREDFNSLLDAAVAGKKQGQ